MQNIKEAFGANLRKIRKSRKLTIDDFAEMSDITPRLLSKIEAGDTFLSAETLCKISVALDMSLRSLFDFNWHDKAIYYDNNKYVKHHFKITQYDLFEKIKSLSGLPDVKINKTVDLGQFRPFLKEFAKKNKMTIYADFFVNKKRKGVFKVTQNGDITCISDETPLSAKEAKNKDDNYYTAIEKINKISTSKKKLEYLLTAVDALDKKKSREKLRVMLDAMDISQ